MEERSLKLYTEKTIFNRITNTLTKMLIPTKIGINGMLISVKRNSMLKSYEATIKENIEESKKEALHKKYEDMYALYLDSIDKYIMDSIYKKVKNDVATEVEKNALSRYYAVTQLKDSQYIEYKYRKQKYLLELDYMTMEEQNKDRFLAKYKKFYGTKMENLYKGILKNYSIQLADSLTSTYQSKIEIYNKIFDTLEEYITNILPIKIEYEPDDMYREILQEYEDFNVFLAGKLDVRDRIEKKMLLLGISRKLFTHSLPLIVAEQCYIQLLKETRNLIVCTKNKKQQDAYELLMKIIDDYNVKLLSTKVYWDKPSQREEYKTFWDGYKKIMKLKDIQPEIYKNKRELYFIKNDLKELNKKPNRYKEIIKIYKKKLVEAGEMTRLKNSYTTIISKSIYVKEKVKVK